MYLTKALVAVAALTSVGAFSVGAPGLRLATSLSMSAAETPRSSSAVTRRFAISLGSLAALGLSAPANAKRVGDVKSAASESDSTETKEEKIERKRREREEYRKKRDEEAKEVEEKAKELTAGKEVKEAEMGSNLRGDYYYPTARKRYLPRVKRAYDTIDQVLASGTLDAKSIESSLPYIDAAGPMKLYVSALSGGGLSISSNFMGEMKKYAAQYEADYKALDGAIKSKKDADTVKVLNGLKETLLSYRAAGKPVGLTGDDWGVGDIPDCKSEAGGTGKMSACAVGSSFGNANPNLYNRNVKKRAQ